MVGDALYSSMTLLAEYNTIPMSNTLKPKAIEAIPSKCSVIWNSI
jgi:hypothetical protein